jgi:prephenate dehydratase|tara:strand:+ start:237678 stop:238517 length:840 start_codon:yes stop_codon:yes gene_type:complete
MTKKIAFQGAKGAYSDLACREACPEYETLPCTSFDEAFAMARDGHADLAMIPVDNTLAGRVADVHRLLPQGGLFVIGEHFQPIHHALVGVRGAKIEDVTDVHSHVHALPQCQNLIKTYNMKPHVQADTASAARDVAAWGRKECAAISSTLAAKLYGLDILAENVEDADHNTTRFLILSREKQIPAFDEESKVITSFIFNVRNIPSALYKAMGGFATNNIQMTKLESYIDAQFNAAHFYAEVEAHPEEQRFIYAMDELEFFAKKVLMLGSYETHAFRTTS